MTPQELKNSILQLAIQGKLVEQRPVEGTAEDLFKQIQTEKQELIKAGKIKKEKPLPEIAEDEKPFKIPESWKWMRLGECSTYSSAKEKISPSDITGDMWSLDLEDIEKETGKIVNYCFAKNRKITGDKVVFHSGQILYSKLRPYLKKILVAPKNGICTPELVPFSMIGAFENAYILYVLKAPHIDFVINSVTYGVKMPRVGTDTMVNLLIPVPPLAEQKRIVAKIEELLPLIDRYEEAWTELEEFNKRFPGDMQKALLQMAIQGKLVEQRSEEGTAEELYNQIQAEKQALSLKSGKIKKDKPIPEITDDEKPFDIPESWKWVHINEVIDVRDGTHDTPKYVSNGVPLVTSKNLIDGGIDFDTAKLISVDDSKTINLRSKVDDGDILFAMIGTIGNPVLVKKDREFSIKNMALFKQYNEDLFEMKYLLYFLRLAQSEMKKAASASVQSFVSLSVLRNYLMPLPPLAEQKRIVAKLEELLPLCDRLK
jgi:type I restriction enzyme S subunit